MIYSRSSEYGIRASLYLCKIDDGKCAMAKQIAESEGLPAHFLAKILQQLARKRLLRSQKGPAACPMHEGWVDLHGRIMKYLRSNTVGSLLKQMEAGTPVAKAKASRESNRALPPSV